MTATETRAVRLTGWGRYAPVAGAQQRRPRADGRHLRRVDRVAHGHPRAARRRGPRDDRLDGRGRRAARDPHRGPRARGHRRHHPRHPHARLLDALDGGAREGGDRQHARLGVRRDGGLLGVRVRLRDRQRLHRRRPRPARAGDRRGAADPVPRLHRPQHLHPVRRRGGRGGAVRLGRADGPRGHRAHDRAPGRVHDLAAGRRREEPAVARDHRPRRAQDPHGGSRDLPLRDPDARVHRAGRRDQGGPRRPATSTCSSRTRRTSGSSRRSPRASTCRWSGCS